MEALGAVVMRTASFSYSSSSSSSSSSSISGSGSGSGPHGHVVAGQSCSRRRRTPGKGLWIAYMWRSCRMHEMANPEMPGYGLVRCPIADGPCRARRSQDGKMARLSLDSQAFHAHRRVRAIVDRFTSS